jgi:hypothetical protein
LFLILVDDRSKIENLIKLTELNLDQNPLGSIPPFNNSNIESLFLQDTSLTSAEFPSSYINSSLQKISLNNNKIRSIKTDDFAFLKKSNLKTLEIDSGSLSSIEQNAFAPLTELQSLSLKNNQLKSCEFLSTFRFLSSIKLDNNQFTSLPQQLSTQKNIKTYSFTNNFISIIDESSPLYTWMKKNYTDIGLYLANNTFDCCQSLWFIRFLKSYAYFIKDAPLLKCSTPSIYAGKQLINLNPNEMNCDGHTPDISWWTSGRIVGVTIGGLAAASISATVVIIITRRRRVRLGYTEIDGVDDPLPSAPIPSFPAYGEDDDTISTYSTAVTTNTRGGQAPLKDEHQI